MENEQNQESIHTKKRDCEFSRKRRKWLTWTRASDPWIVGQTWLESSHWIIVHFKNHVSLFTHSIKMYLKKWNLWPYYKKVNEMGLFVRWKGMKICVKLWSGRRKRLCFYRYREKGIRGKVFSWWIIVGRNFWCLILSLSEWLEERGCMFVFKNDGKRM